MSVLTALGSFAAMLSALMFYASTPQRHWPRLARLRRRGVLGGAVFALVSLCACIAELGIGAGISVALCVWMISAVALPWLALATRTVATERGDRA